jgi:hypothetical protein
MSLYAGIDLHANNSYLAVIDESDEPVVVRRLPNELELVLKLLEPYREELMDTFARASEGPRSDVSGPLE